MVISKLDVSNEQSVQAFFDLAIEKFGRVDFAANIAGYGHPATPSIDLPESEFDKSFNVNLKGVRGLPEHQCRVELMTCVLSAGLSL